MVEISKLDTGITMSKLYNMDLNNIFNNATNVIWQDYKGFLRIESNCDYREIFHCMENICEKPYFIFIMLPLIVFMPIWWFLGPLSAKSNRFTISKYTHDIELTPNVYKLIRDVSGNLGICYWYNWYNCHLLLAPSYNQIQHFGNDAFIVNIKGKFGIYNAKLQKMVVKPLYSSYEFDGNFVIFSNKNATEKYNTYGERIML